ncbi:retrovirus-related pol polyprotein line-1 [Plakobranchus ocellatus]|uniref:Retrovirus-related pol polyprotein line-1 n=1 Tax=Plakobranchus ocellatus TaxID=259542 RepID=A0AAV4B2M7_9GAST|nr:retrovirus-related pol polyprotein line-1 [Plakobranchus ocellatus]
MSNYITFLLGVLTGIKKHLQELKNSSAFKSIKTGVRQGCVMSPDLFSLYSEIFFRDIDDISRLEINGENHRNLGYADETVLIEESPDEQLQKRIDTVTLVRERMGPPLKVKKNQSP